MKLSFHSHHDDDGKRWKFIEANQFARLTLSSLTSQSRHKEKFHHVPQRNLFRTFSRFMGAEVSSIALQSSILRRKSSRSVLLVINLFKRASIIMVVG
jgi:hypothetical protein